ncbi:MAG: hypothetical protein JSV14_15025 [Deltaproteobacteria bacterium]|nr:MAG: hypothetical protein JSV14_15025 [Deltaproteobacteria bacterium]
MAQIELKKIDAGTIRGVFWFREKRKSVILHGQLDERIINATDRIFTP